MTGRFRFQMTSLEGLMLIERLPVSDRRGCLERLFCVEEFSEIGLDAAIAQINRTLTQQRGTIRGLHFQYPPSAETKIVSCLRGEIFDVAVDLRSSSPSFLHWYGEVLSGENKRSLFIPPGFAHGFQTLMDDCELLYFHTSVYDAKAEGGVSAFDPCLAISWPLPLSNMSERDRGHAPLAAEFKGIAL